MTTLILVVGGAVSLSFLCSILEAVLLSISYSYVSLMRDRGGRAGEWLHRMQERIDEPIAAILTLNTIANTLGATFGGALALRVLGNEWIAVFSGGLTLTILLVSEIVPKTLGATYWQQLARPATYVLMVLVFVMKPLLVPLRAFARLITPTSERPSTVTREELEVLAHMGWHAGTIDEDEFQVVRNVIRLDEVSASEVMTPRTDIVAVPLGATIDEAADIMLREGHLRLPVYRDSLDHIEGVILGRDVWRAQREGVRDVRDVLRPVAFFPASKSVEELIPELRSRRHKMAIVVDEFGGTAGLITLEDLIEEIVGEIQDEHEDEPEPFTHLPGGRVRVWGAVSIRDANQELGLSLPDDDHDTLGGYIFGRLKRVGRVGDEIEVEGGRFRIARMRGRRIDSLIFTPDEDAGDD